MIINKNIVIYVVQWRKWGEEGSPKYRCCGDSI